MPDILQDIDEILDSFPDNNLRDISAQQLRNYVVSISAFGSKRRETTGAQMIDTTPVELIFDGLGVLRNVGDGAVNDLEILVGGDGDYEIIFSGSVNTQTARNYELMVALDGVPINTITWVRGDGNIKAFSGSITKNLSEGDLVSIFCEADAAGSDFFLQIGSQFSIKRLL